MLGAGGDLAEVLRLLDITESAWRRWRCACAGMSPGHAKRLKELEVECLTRPGGLRICLRRASFGCRRCLAARAALCARS